MDWEGLALELSAPLTLLAGLLVVALGALVRALAPAEAPRLRLAASLFGLHVLLLPVAVSLAASGSQGAPGTRLAASFLAALAAIQVLAAFLFAVLLPRLPLRAPGILRDVLVAGAAAMAFFALGSRAGMNLSHLIATSTVLTAVVGLSLQDTLGNVMAGLALQLDQSLQVGDWVTVGEANGRVTEIRWRSTSLETRSWETLVVPNSLLVKNSFVVLGRRQGQPSQWRRAVTFNVDFRTPPTEVVAAVEEQLRAAPLAGVSPQPPPHCILLELGESYARYAARYWLTQLDSDDGVDSQVRTRIWFALRRVGIPLSIPAQALFVTEESQTRRARQDEREQESRLRALQGADVFEALGDDDRRRLAQSLRPAPFTRGEQLARQGTPGDALYLVVSGSAEVRVRAESGDEREVARLGPGDVFGEMSLMTGAPRAATVVALSDMACYRLDKGAFEAVLRARPELLGPVAEVLVRREGELSAVRHALDDGAARRAAAVRQRDLVDRIRAFFGLDPDAR